MFNTFGIFEICYKHKRNFQLFQVADICFIYSSVSWVFTIHFMTTYLQGMTIQLVSCVVVRNTWSCASTPPHIFVAWYLIKYWGKVMS